MSKTRLISAYNFSPKGCVTDRPTETRKNMNLPYSIHMYWTNFWQPTIHAPQYIWKKTLTENGSSHSYASFGTFCVQIGQLFEAQADFKLLEEIKIFLRKQWFCRFQTFFKDSLCLQKLADLDAKDAKRSVKIWATKFYRIFFKNILLQMNGRLSIFRSVHTYVRCFCDEL